MKYEEIEPHIIDYIKGNLDESLEYRIKAYIKENPDFQKEIDELKDTLDFVQDVPFEEPEPSLKMEFYAMLNEYQSETKEEKISLWANILQYLQSKTFVQRATTIGSFILVIFLAGYFTSNLINQPVTQKESVSAVAEEEIAEQPTLSEDTESILSTDSEDFVNKEKPPLPPMMNDSMGSIALADYEETAEDQFNISGEEMDDFSFGSSRTDRGLDGMSRDALPVKSLESDERIQNIYTSLENTNQDEIIIQALIKALNSDPNPNVRIAAIDALEKFADSNQVKYLIAQSLDNQNSATVQLATLDLIVKYQIKEGAPSIKKLLVQPELNQTVRQQAEIALEIIS